MYVPGERIGVVINGKMREGFVDREETGLTAEGIKCHYVTIPVWEDEMIPTGKRDGTDRKTKGGSHDPNTDSDIHRYRLPGFFAGGR